MSATIVAVIDGEQVPLDQCGWVRWAPCGCATGITAARYRQTEESAWRSFYDRKRDIDRAQQRGEWMELITNQRWHDEVKDLMRSKCPHASKSSSDKRGNDE